MPRIFLQRLFQGACFDKQRIFGRNIAEEDDSTWKLGSGRRREEHLCAWGNDAASEVLTEARLLLVENYFQTPS
ncbi:hypothetical protein I3843_08G169000 [Carya illinoinensis]|nr:hypothetical protein I3843_08G169000 [Carya illinoinensis]